MADSSNTATAASRPERATAAPSVSRRLTCERAWFLSDRANARGTMVASPIMDIQSFRRRAVTCLRDDHQIDTECLPHEELEHDDGLMLIDGTLVRAARDNPFSKAALWAFAASYGSGLAAGQGVGGGLEVVLHLVTGASAFAAFWLLVAAFYRRRGRREPLVIALHARTRTRGPVEAATIEAVRDEAGANKAWIMAEAGYTADALLTADRLHVRCYALEADHFVAPSRRAFANEVADAA